VKYKIRYKILSLKWYRGDSEDKQFVRRVSRTVPYGLPYFTVKLDSLHPLGASSEAPRLAF